MVVYEIIQSEFDKPFVNHLRIYSGPLLDTRHVDTHLSARNQCGNDLSLNQSWAKMDWALFELIDKSYLAHLV